MYFLFIFPDNITISNNKFCSLIITWEGGGGGGGHPDFNVDPNRQPLNYAKSYIHAQPIFL